MATEDVAINPPAGDPPVPTSHPIGFYFLFAGEFAERCSFYGMRAILSLYMTERLGVDEGNAGMFMSCFIALCYFFPLIGGWVADNYIGKYWTIVGFSAPYIVAHLIIGIEDQWTVAFALILAAMGSGVIKPNISTLMGMTYDQQRPGQERLLTSAFSLFYISINIGAFLSQLLVPIIRTEFNYQLAFFFPAVLMFLALGFFAAGKRFFATETIERKVVTENPSQPIPDGKTVTGLTIKYTPVTQEQKAADQALRWQTVLRIMYVFLTVMFFWAVFDQSASTWIFFANTFMDCTIFGYAVPPDSIQSLNALFIVLFVPVSLVLYSKLDRAGYKVKATHKITAGFILTGVSMAILGVAGLMAGQKQETLKLITPDGELVLPMWDGGKLEDVQSSGGEPVTIGTGVQVRSTEFEYNADKNKVYFGSGAVVLADGTEIAIDNGRLSSETPDAEVLTGGGVLESILTPNADRPAQSDDLEKPTLQVVEWVKPEQRVTVWWQVFAYVILTIGEILISITGLELAFVAAPQSMKGFVTACWLFTVGLGNLVLNIPLTQIYPLMSPGPYFMMLAGMMGVITLIFLPIAVRFNRGLEADKAKGDHIKGGDTQVV